MATNRRRHAYSDILVDTGRHVRAVGNRVRSATWRVHLGIGLPCRSTTDYRNVLRTSLIAPSRPNSGKMFDGLAKKA